MTGLPRTTDKDTLMSECRWLNIAQLTDYQYLIQLWKTYRWNVPKHLKDKIHLTPEDKITTTPPRLLLTTNSFRWRTTERWNMLPDHLRTEMSISRFKKGVKKWLKERRTPETGIQNLQED